MADLNQYRDCIRKIITDYASYISSNDEIEAQVIADTKDAAEGTRSAHYQLLYIGWQNKRRVFSPVMHFDIKDGKIWIQWNGTEEEVGEQLVAMGVPKHDIVVGFHPPFGSLQIMLSVNRSKDADILGGEGFGELEE